ncbi:purine-binding chemotaxis protein CheW [Methanofollis aquaemaris]|uniref:Purine-binding chemotaxis protein CheW n=1 Tax=Methanofollis aquaemaris TaxID=126734 RepID=A0A8A3S5I0_9EURY|nr:chemotaxis protein CheW [Methanofollis aquaemaris]QSZ67322.1 purine-binding chemotaxis protein CheW [Methanofollis aquaemaris]
MGETIDIVAFELGGTRYALDILLAREIVEMLPVTPVPRAPSHISGVINLRGEVTNIIDLGTLLQIPEHQTVQNKKIIVLVPDVTGGSNIGMIVDDVHSVMQVAEKDIEAMDSSLCREAYVKGIIRAGTTTDEGGVGGDLIIWIDIKKALEDLECF